MTTPVSETARSWLKEARAMTNLAIARREIIEDITRYHTADDDKAEGEKKIAKLTKGINAAVARLRKLEAESDTPIGATALLGTPDVLDSELTTLGILGTASLAESVSSQMQSVGVVVELAAGSDVAALTEVRDAFASGSILRPHVTLSSNANLLECSLMLTENAYRALAGQEPDPAFIPEAVYGPSLQLRRR